MQNYNGKLALKSKLNSDSEVLYATEFANVDEKANKFADSKDYVIIGTTKYYANNAKVFEIDFDDQDKDYDDVKSLVEVDIDELESLKDVAFVTDLDHKEHTFGTMVLTASNIKGEKKWAYITKVSDYDDNDDDTKENKVIEVIYEGETDVTELYADSTKVNNLPAVGTIAEIEVEDNIITKPIKVSGFTDGTLSANLVAEDEGVRIAKQFGNGTISFNKCIEGNEVDDATNLTDTFSIAEDVIVIKRDGSKDSVSSFGAISFLEKGTHYNSETKEDLISETDLKNSNEILEVYTWKDKDTNDVEIIAIVYAK